MSECSVDQETREWVEKRFSWLVAAFGLERLRQATVVLPTDKYFPDAYDGSDETLRVLLDRTCGYVGVDPNRVELEVYEDRNPLHDEHGQKGTLGWYSEEEGIFRIAIEAASLDDPLSVVATMAHELAHVLLLGERRMHGDEEDMEKVTDLATVFLGLGVITANATIREKYWHEGRESGWQISKQGYLGMQAYGYALAIFARTRGESTPTWEKELRLDVRRIFQKSMLHVQESGYVPTPAIANAPRSEARRMPAPTRPTPPLTNERMESTNLVATCTYCGVHFDPETGKRSGVCLECDESIRANVEALEAEQVQGTIGRRFFRIWVLTFIGAVAAAAVVAWIRS